VRSRHNASSDADCLWTTNPLERLFLDDPKHFSLHGHVKFTDLIEKNSSEIGELEFSRFAAEGARIGSLFVPKQLILDQGVRNGSTIHGHEGLVSPWAQLMNRTRKYFLASTALTGEQNGSIGRSDTLNGLTDCLHGGAVPYDLGNAVCSLELFSQGCRKFKRRFGAGIIVRTTKLIIAERY